MYKERLFVCVCGMFPRIGDEAKWQSGSAWSCSRDACSSNTGGKRKNQTSSAAQIKRKAKRTDKQDAYYEQQMKKIQDDADKDIRRMMANHEMAMGKLAEETDQELKEMFQTAGATIEFVSLTE